MKPPKSWLTEYAQNHSKKHRSNDLDRTKANAPSFGTNMDNTFRHYMAKKIHLQRDQFGLVLPPPPSPPPSPPPINVSKERENENEHEHERGDHGHANVTKCDLDPNANANANAHQQQHSHADDYNSSHSHSNIVRDRNRNSNSRIGNNDGGESCGDSGDDDGMMSNQQKKHKHLSRSKSNQEQNGNNGNAEGDHEEHKVPIDSNPMETQKEKELEKEDEKGVKVRVNTYANQHVQVHSHAEEEEAATSMAGLLGRLRKKQKQKRRSGSAAQLAQKRDRKRRRRLRERGVEAEVEAEAEATPRPASAATSVKERSEMHMETQTETQAQTQQKQQAKMDMGAEMDRSDDTCSKSLLDVDGVSNGIGIMLTSYQKHHSKYSPLTQMNLSQEEEEAERDIGIKEDEDEEKKQEGVEKELQQEQDCRHIDAHAMTQTLMDLSKEATQEMERGCNDEDEEVDRNITEDMGTGIEQEEKCCHHEYAHAPLTQMNRNLSRDSSEDDSTSVAGRGEIRVLELHEHEHENGEATTSDSCLTCIAEQSTSKNVKAACTSPPPSPLPSSSPSLSSSPSSKLDSNNIDIMRQLKRERKDLFFLGVTVLVNGFTNPCADTIMRTLHRHGGNLEKYETSTVTHIIAETLSTAKAKIYKRQKRPVPVVRPSWIMDCAREQRLLSHVDYLLDEVKDDDRGKVASVKDYFGKKKENKVDKVSVRPESESAIAGSMEEEVHASRNIDTGMEIPPESDDHSDGGSGSNNHLQQTVCVDESNTTTEKSDIPNGTNGTQCKDNASKRHKFKGGHRTVGTDPDFLESYFNSSRLSFIGSFKQRLKHSETNHCGSHHHATIRCDDSQRFVFHVDMDCFFAAIALRKYPQFRDKPVAVGHAWSNDPNGIHADAKNHQTEVGHGKKSNSELSTCNYKAREYGVRKGMFLSRAKELCPELVVLPYDYDGYEDAAKKTGEILQGYVAHYDGALEQRSCDESYLELFLVEERGGSDFRNVVELAKSIGEKIRNDIYSATECTVSVGIGENKLLAKLATNQVKDRGGNGVFAVAGEGKKLLHKLSLKDLEGIGYRLNQKLLSHNLSCVQDVLDMDNGKEELCRILGPGNGTKIFNYCHGIDDRAVENALRKTIGAECNYGVRFDGIYGVDYMMEGLAKEVEKRMKTVGVLGRHITVKVKERQTGAPPPGKFNGHGKCNDHSKSSALPGKCAIRDTKVIAREGMKLFHEIGVSKDEVRGMGIVISKLEMENLHPQEGQLSSWFSRKAWATTDHPSKSVTSATGGETLQKQSHHGPSSFESNKRKSVTWKHDESLSKDSDVITCNQETETNRMDDNDNEKCNVNQARKCNKVVKAKSHSLVATNRRTSSDIKKNKHKAHKVCRPRNTVAKSDGRFRQYDVKSMLKLASIKSGEDKLSLDGEQVSLSQLGSLPLDIQLQVANEDSGGTLSHPQSCQTSIPITKSKSAGTNEIIEIDDDDNESVFTEQASSDDIESVEEVDEAAQDSDDERGDIVVLRQWMDEHSDPSPDNIELVEDFLCVCVSEKRLDDVVSMLRLIKMRSDPWGVEHYKVLLEKTEKAIKSFEGKQLDLDWLGLLP